MSLRKSPTLTPKFLAANRSNAAKSTGPRTARGKAVSSLSRLKHGDRSPKLRALISCLRYNPYRLGELADQILTSQEKAHPIYGSLIRAWERQFGPGRAQAKAAKDDFPNV